MGILPNPFDTFSAHQVGSLLYAHCLRSNEITRERVGRLLADDKEHAPEMLRGFIARVDMAGCSLVDAVRNLLLVLALPGEAQLIERIFHAFAERFSEIGGLDEEETAMSFDAAFVL